MTAAVMVSLIATSKKTLSELVRQLPKRHIIKDRIVAKKGADIIALLPAQFPDCKIDQTDGVKIFTKNAWALVRASGTEPIIRIIIDAKSPTAGSALYQDLKSRLKTIMGS
jgi:phosphomannomutase/phosphoglucomutase